MQLGGKALTGLVDLAQIAVQGHALHLQLLLYVLHLLLVGALHQNAGQLALGGVGQLGQHLILGAVQCTAVTAVVQLLAHLLAELFHGVHAAHFLGKVAVHGRQLAHAHVVQLDLEHHSLAGQVLCMVALREGDVDVEFVACLVAQDAVLKAGDHAAAAQLHGLVLCGAALEGHAVQQALKVHVHHVALHGRALVGHQLGGGIAAALQHRVDLLVGHGGSDALHHKTGGLGQVQLRLQGHGGGGYKALVLFHAHQVVAGLVHRVEAVLGQRSVVQCGHVLVHQVVDGVVPEGVLTAVGLDLGTVGLAFFKALDRIVGAGALIHRVGCGFQFFGGGAEGHFADALFRSFHAYQFHRIYPPCCPLQGNTGLRTMPCGMSGPAPVSLPGCNFKHIVKLL